MDAGCVHANNTRRKTFDSTINPGDLISVTAACSRKYKEKNKKTGGFPHESKNLYVGRE